MSYQDLRHHYEDRDDEPERDRIPVNAWPPHRFMQKAAHGRWDVFGWLDDPCHCVMLRGSDEPPSVDPKCPDCGGSGIGSPDTEPVCYDLSEADARLLVFGDEILAALKNCEKVLLRVGDPFSGDDHEAMQRVRDAIAKAEGRT